MALDNANFIAELSITDPPGSDPLSQGDDQIRTIKRATFQSFPLIDKAVNLDADQLNLAAIKDEANTFTAPQIIAQDLALSLDVLATSATRIRYMEAGVSRWELQKLGSGSLSDFALRRNDIAGAQVDQPFRVSLTTGVVDFAKPPTVAGAPLWIAGEIRQFVGAVTLGTNWFLADGTNGTKNLADRWLVGSGAFAGAPGTDLQAELTAQAAAGVTGSTAITEAQMPQHNHPLLGGSASGTTDVQVGFASSITVTGANRNNIGPALHLDENTSGNKYINDTGGGAGHTHTSPAQNVEASNPTFTNSVQPVSVAVETWQYVP